MHAFAFIQASAKMAAAGERYQEDEPVVVSAVAIAPTSPSALLPPQSIAQRVTPSFAFSRHVLEEIICGLLYICQQTSMEHFYRFVSSFGESVFATYLCAGSVLRERIIDILSETGEIEHVVLDMMRSNSLLSRVK
jgi:hypothetical protein